MTYALTATGARLHAMSEPIGGRGDLLDHLAPGGFAWLDGPAGFVTAGTAAVVTPGDAAALLAGVTHEVTPATPAEAGPRAVGALPFDASGEGSQLVVPARILGRTAEGRWWCTTIADVPVPEPARGESAPPARYEVRAHTTRDRWDGAVATALDEIARGRLEKVVLAREVSVSADRPFDLAATLAWLRATQPGCRVYAHGGFVGASAELLVARHGAEVVSRPMAGTGGDAARLRTSEKDAREHRLVVDAVVAALREVCADVTPSAPRPVRLTDVAHLATTVRATVRAGAVGTSALALALALHPTPAVGGSPRDAALDLIRVLEGFDRDRYAGPCGWVDAAGDGEFVVALRCAHVDGAYARLHAGAGIVAGSDAGSEWAETQVKLDPMLRALVRP